MSKNTPSYIHDFPLKTNKHIDRKLAIKFRCLRELYNMVLAEVFRRNKKLRNDPRFKKANLLNKKEETKPEAKLLYKALDEDYKLKNNYLQSFATCAKNSSYMKDHLDGDTVQVISDRAFNAFNEYRFKKRGKPRFKSLHKGLKSICGKKNACVSFKDGKVKWKDLSIDVVYDKKDKHGVQFHALSQKVKYCRINSKFVKGKIRYYLQLVVEGTPLQRHFISDSSFALDVGVSTVAAVSDDKAILVPFCDGLVEINREIKALQRKSSRSLKMNNPTNYDKNGKIIKGSKNWKKSNRYLKIQNQIKELYRVQTDKRKTLHNILANEMLSFGKYIKIENNNYKAWQKGWFGKTIGFRAPSTFVSTLTRKAESAGGKVDPIDTWTSKLSQYCHVCQTFKKKSLSLRTHNCCGITVQRDLYSALLAKHYDLKKKQVNANHIVKIWSSLDTILKGAALTYENKYRVSSPSANQSVFSSKEKRRFRRRKLRLCEKREKRCSHEKSNELLVSSHQGKTLDGRN